MEGRLVEVSPRGEEEDAEGDCEPDHGVRGGHPVLLDPLLLEGIE